MIIIIISVVLLSLFSSSISEAVLAFPTAEGYGANASGGRGGSVCYVTTLADSGTNSLRDCLTRSGTRNVLFKVSGTIVLESIIYVDTPNITIAGQTSPGGVHVRWVTPNIDGRLTTGGVEGATGIQFNNFANNVIIRHMHFRGGGYYQGDGNSNIQFYSNRGGVTPNNFILDHITDMWTADASPGYYGDTWDNATLQWSLVAEGANLCDAPNLGQTCPGSSKGAHIGGPGTSKGHVSIHHNAFISNGIRNPLIQGIVLADMRNNFIYNWYGNNATDTGEFLNDATVFINVINNVYVRGPSSSTPVFWVGNILGGNSCGSASTNGTRVDGSSADLGGSRIYSSGNWGPGLHGETTCINGCADDWIIYGSLDWWRSGIDTGCFPSPPQSTVRLNTPLTVDMPVTTHPTSEVESRVLAIVGAIKPFRDSIDTRVINSTLSRSYCGLATFGCVTVTGGNSLGDWNIYNSNTPAPVDTDGDGIPDTWEINHNLNPNNINDGAAITADGYSNLEHYLNELAGDGEIIIGNPTLPSPSNLRIINNQ